LNLYRISYLNLPIFPQWFITVINILNIREIELVK